MKIQVTQEDILHGVARNSYHCPVARAVSKAYGLPLLDHSPTGPVDADTSLITIRLQDDKAYTYYTTPEVVRQFMRMFDNDEAVEPFEFELPQEEQL